MAETLRGLAGDCLALPRERRADCEARKIARLREASPIRLVRDAQRSAELTADGERALDRRDAMDRQAPTTLFRPGEDARDKIVWSVTPR